MVISARARRRLVAVFYVASQRQETNIVRADDQEEDREQKWRVLAAIFLAHDALNRIHQEIDDVAKDVLQTPRFWFHLHILRREIRENDQNDHNPPHRRDLIGQYQISVLIDNIGDLFTGKQSLWEQRYHLFLFVITAPF